MRTGRTNEMTRNRFPVQKKMLERRNKPKWITYHSEKLNKIQENHKFKDQNDFNRCQIQLCNGGDIFTCEI